MGDRISFTGLSTGIDFQSIVDATILARQRRIEFPGAVYHVMARGDRREPMVCDEGDREAFLRTLGEDTNPVFLTEYGIGSANDLWRIVRHFERLPK